MTRGSMPGLQAIIDYWAPHSDTPKVFPDLRLWSIGTGEPFCFRCGWLAPVTDDGKWDRASGWLERCHLLDHALGGSELPENLVPMCVACHSIMPMCPTKEAGIEFVNEEEDPVFVGRIQMTTDSAMGEGFGGRKAEHYWRLRARALEATVASYTDQPVSRHFRLIKEQLLRDGHSVGGVLQPALVRDAAGVKDTFGLPLNRVHFPGDTEYLDLARGQKIRME